jgi:hypothetical protein
MAKKNAAARGTRGRTGPAGPAGPPGRIGTRGRRGATGPIGARGAAGPVGALGPDADPRRLIKALDAQVEGIYRELTSQMTRLSTVQMQLGEMRAAIRRLGGGTK